MKYIDYSRFQFIWKLNVELLQEKSFKYRYMNQFLWFIEKLFLLLPSGNTLNRIRYKLMNLRTCIFHTGNMHHFHKLCIDQIRLMIVPYTYYEWVYILLKFFRNEQSFLETCCFDPNLNREKSLFEITLMYIFMCSETYDWNYVIIFYAVRTVYSVLLNSN